MELNPILTEREKNVNRESANRKQRSENIKIPRRVISDLPGDSEYTRLIRTSLRQRSPQP